MSVNDPTQLVVAHKIGVDPGTPGLGTVTSLAAGAGITLTPNPITASGTVAGKLYTISTQGDVPAPGTNDGSKILFDNGWTVAAIPPIPVPPVDGGTGADLSGLSAGQLIAFDGASAFGGVTDGVGVLTSDGAGNLSWETPASGGVTLQASSPGTPDTGGLNVSLDGIFGGNIVASGTGSAAHVAIGTGVGVDATINLTAILPGVVGNAYTVILEAGVGLGVALSALEVGTEITVTLGTDGAGDPDPTKNTATLVKGVLDGESTLFTSALAGDGSGVLVPESQLFFGGAEAITATAGSISALAGFVKADQIIGASLAGISGFFQTPDAAGGNAYPTLVAAGNASQTAPLQEWRGTDGTTLLSQMTIGGNYRFALSDDGGGNTTEGILEAISGVVNFRLRNAGTPIAPLAEFNIGYSIAGQNFLTISVGDQGSNLPYLWKFGNADGSGNLFPDSDNALDIGIPGSRIRTFYGGTGVAATASIGSGTDGAVNLVADDPGIAGNEFTATVAAGVGLNVPMTAAFTLQALLVTLGTDGAGALDPAKNTATLVAGAINTAAGGVTATASGTGADPLTGAEGPTTFTGGAESLTLAGGLSANANIYLTNLPGSDPGIPGALYQTAGVVMVSV